MTAVALDPVWQLSFCFLKTHFGFVSFTCTYLFSPNFVLGFRSDLQWDEDFQLYEGQKAECKVIKWELL